MSADTRPAAYTRIITTHSATIMLISQLLCLVLASIQCAVAVINFSPQVVTPNGILQGEAGKSGGGRTFYKFWCVPFGKAERFEVNRINDD